jgi:hypothetical protein
MFLGFLFGWWTFYGKHVILSYCVYCFRLCFTWVAFTFLDLEHTRKILIAHYARVGVVFVLV